MASTSGKKMELISAAAPLLGSSEVTVATVTLTQKQEMIREIEAQQPDGVGSKFPAPTGEYCAVETENSKATVCEQAGKTGDDGGKDVGASEVPAQGPSKASTNSSKPGSKTDTPPNSEEVGEEEWSDLFMGSLTSKGMKLEYLTPGVEEGTKVAKLEAEDVDNKKWSNSMIFYVIGMKPTLAAVYRFVSYNWNYVSKPKIFMHDDGYFIISFESAKDLHEILYSGPHMFFGKPTITKIWSPNFNLHEEVLKSVPLWVKLPNLPLNCWSKKCLSRITSVIGEPVCADECTTRQLRISFARVLVDIDVTKELPNSIRIVDPNGNQFDQVVIYEWIPPFCKTCNRVGHDCSKPPPPARNKPGVRKGGPKPHQDQEPSSVIPGATYVPKTQNQPQQKSHHKQPMVPIKIAYPTYELNDGEGWQQVPKKQWHTTHKNIPISTGSKFVLLESLPEEIISGKEGGDDNPIPAP